MGKKKVNENSFENLEIELFDRYARWRDIYENGCTDPSWSDGVNIDLVRTHIIISKKKCLEHLKEGQYPDPFYYPLPPVLSKNFMAKARKNVGIDGDLPETPRPPYDEVLSYETDYFDRLTGKVEEHEVWWSYYGK